MTVTAFKKKVLSVSKSPENFHSISSNGFQDIMRARNFHTPVNGFCQIIPNGESFCVCVFENYLEGIQY